MKSKTFMQQHIAKLMGVTAHVIKPIDPMKKNNPKPRNHVTVDESTRMVNRGTNKGPAK